MSREHLERLVAAITMAVALWFASTTPYDPPPRKNNTL